MATLFPTLFIGIGSTGAEILGSLQKHLFEEYQEDDFPIFHLLGLISDASDKSKANNIYKIDWCPMQVPDTSVVKEQIDFPKNRAWCENLKKWLPRQIFNTAAFTNGSGGKRVAGRLHLWENHDTIYNMIQDAKDKIQSGINSSLKILQNRGINGVEIPNNEIKVYILGSLGGGTCSGMCIDTAYLVREIMGTHLKAITGIFTIPNYEQSKDPLMQKGSINSNSYAALTELAYYFYYDQRNRPLKHYFYDKEIPNKPPYDDVYLESCSNSKNKVLRKNHDGSYDYSSLCEMIGMNLYLDCGSETSELKDGLRTDYSHRLTSKLQATYKLPDPITGEPRSFCSFGATSINYPKYSLARATACVLLKDRFSKFTTRDESKGLTTEEMKKLVSNKFKALIEFVKIKLAGDIQSQINKELETFENKIKSVSSSELEDIIRNYPKDIENKKTESFSKLFLSNGSYAKELKSKIGIIKEEVFAKTREIIDSFRENTTSLEESSIRSDNFKKLIKDNISNKVIQEVKIDYNQLNPYIIKIAEIEEDWFHALTFSKEDSLVKRKEQLADAYKKVIQKAFNQLRSNVSIELYQDIYSEFFNIGGISQINKLSNKIDDLKDTFEDEKNKILNQFHDMKHMMLCSETELYGNGTDNNQIINWANSEVSHLKDLLIEEKIVTESKTDNIIYKSFINDASLTEPTEKQFESALISRKPNEVNEGCLRMIDEITKIIIKYNKKPISFKELFKNISDQNQRHDFEELVKSSFFYNQLDDSTYYNSGCRFSFDTGYGLRVRLLPKKDKFDITSLDSFDIFKNKNEKWIDKQDLSTDHFILFYTEEPGFAPSHMMSYQEWASSYESKKAMGNNTIDLDWTEEEWRHSKIDFKKEARTEFLRFIIENINRVFPNNTFKDGDGNSFFSVWDKSKKYYLDIPKKESELPIDIRIDLEEYKIYSDILKNKDNSYAMAAKSEYNPRLENYLFKKLRIFFNCLDMNTFLDKCDDLINNITQEEKILIDDKEKGNSNLRPDEYNKERFIKQWEKMNINAFRAYIKEVIYRDKLEDFEKEFITNRYPIDPRSEKEGTGEKGEFDFRFLIQYENKR